MMSLYLDALEDARKNARTDADAAAIAWAEDEIARLRKGGSQLVNELRGWNDSGSMSDDARRKLYLMRKAADRIERLEKALEQIADDPCSSSEGIARNALQSKVAC